MDQLRKQKYAKFLISRLFISIDFPSIELFLEAIREVNAMCDETQWRDKKTRYNQIAMKAPMSDNDGYCLSYREVPDFIETECQAYVKSL